MKKLLSLMAVALMATTMWAGEPQYQEMSIAEVYQAEQGSFVSVKGQVVDVQLHHFIINADGKGLRCDLTSIDIPMPVQQGDMVIVYGGIGCNGTHYGEINLVFIDEVEIIQTGLVPVPTEYTIEELNLDPMAYYLLLAELTECTYVGPSANHISDVDLAKGESVIECSGFNVTPCSECTYNVMGTIGFLQNSGAPVLMTKTEWITVVGETALDDATMDAKVQKTLRDGKLVITTGDKSYDATGSAL